MKRMLSGIKPTGQLTLGNYIGALRNFVNYQDDYEMYVFIANLHCVTVYQEPADLKKNLRDAVALYLAAGLDPEKSTIFLQSDVMEQAQLGWLLACNSYMGELNRMTQFKDHVAKGETNLTAGLYVYPCLMAADILAYNADYVPVGVDQKQHVELTRDIAIRFNNKYGDTFTVPEPLTQKVGAKIMSLSDPSKKMSKSDLTNKGCIYLLDEPKAAMKKIMSAKTDSLANVAYDKENQPGLANLIEIACALTGEPIEEFTNRFKGCGYGDLKKEVAADVGNFLTDLQERYDGIVRSDLLRDTLENGRQKAEPIARKTLHKVQRKIGVEIFR
ncbi:MAG: tryptophan--tRNA ligase [Erysipelotrichales bacterium]|nr:tryptophan--tRNA ligase [Erysipelotrichales bacterium]